MAERVYLLLGSNDGPRERLLEDAMSALSDAAAGPATRSSMYETAPWGMEAQPPFLNVAIGFDTSLSPDGLLQMLRHIEAAYGRQRSVVWGQRTLDIDIIFYGAHIIHTPELSIPHPRMRERRFALVPLAEIAPQFMHPVVKKSVAALLEECADNLPVTLLR